MKITGCWFYYNQTVRRKIAKMPKLAAEISRTKKYERIYHKLLCIPLLPANKINLAFNLLQIKMNAALFKQFLEYFDQ
jgi:hypothetical protein